MDLLAGGSDSEEDDDNDSIVSDKEDAHRTNDSDIKSAPSKRDSHVHVETKQPFTIAQKHQRVIGKRIIGLEAVLPQNIRDRMAMVKTFHDDSDDSDDEEDVQPQAPSSKTDTTAAGGGGGGAGRDLELSGLLSELKQSKSTTNNNDNGNGARSTKSSMLTQDKLPQVETVEEEEEEEHEEKTASGPSSSLSNRMKSTLSERTRGITPSVSSVPAPAWRKVSHAVPQPSRLLHAQQKQQTHPNVTPTTAATRNLVSHNSYETSTHKDHAIEATSTTTTTTATTSRQNRTQKKRSRQKMEQALRSGNLDVVDEGQYAGPSTVVTFGDNYQEGTTTFTLDNSGLQPPQHTQYNFPKINTDTIDMKAKGKHQINQLLAQASQLERQRAEQSSIMRHTSTGSSAKRSGSKQKYGW